jgi:hypothetical protein
MCEVAVCRPVFVFYLRRVSFLLVVKGVAADATDALQP